MQDPWEIPSLVPGSTPGRTRAISGCNAGWRCGMIHRHRLPLLSLSLSSGRGYVLVPGSRHGIRTTAIGRNRRGRLVNSALDGLAAARQGLPRPVRGFRQQKARMMIRHPCRRLRPSPQCQRLRPNPFPRRPADLQSPREVLGMFATARSAHLAPHLAQHGRLLGTVASCLGTFPLAEHHRPVSSRHTRGLFLNHAGVFEHVCPLPTGAGVAVLEVLAEVVGTVELLARVALAKLVHVLEMTDPVLPVLVADANSGLGLPGSGKLIPAVPANVGFAGPCGAVVERPLIASQRRTRPAVPPNVEGILVPFSLILVFEAVSAKRALVLFLGLVSSAVVGATS